MKKILSLLLVLIMVLSLCACDSKTSPEETLIGFWTRVDDSSLSIRFDKDGSASIFLNGKSNHDLSWEFIDEQTLEHNETKKTITLYSYKLHWNDSYTMITEAGGKENLMLQWNEHTVYFEKQQYPVLGS